MSPMMICLYCLVPGHTHRGCTVLYRGRGGCSVCGRPTCLCRGHVRGLHQQLSLLVRPEHKQEGQGCVSEPRWLASKVMHKNTLLGVAVGSVWWLVWS